MTDQEYKLNRMLQILTGLTLYGEIDGFPMPTNSKTNDSFDGVWKKQITGMLYLDTDSKQKLINDQMANIDLTSIPDLKGDSQISNIELTVEETSNGISIYRVSFTKETVHAVYSDSNFFYNKQYSSQFRQLQSLFVINATRGAWGGDVSKHRQKTNTSLDTTTVYQTGLLQSLKKHNPLEIYEAMSKHCTDEQLLLIEKELE